MKRLPPKLDTATARAARAAVDTVTRTDKAQTIKLSYGNEWERLCALRGSTPDTPPSTISVASKCDGKTRVKPTDSRDAVESNASGADVPSFASPARSAADASSC